MKKSMTIRRRSEELRSQQAESLQAATEKVTTEEKINEKNKTKINRKVVEVTKDILEQPIGTFRSSWARGMQEELQRAAEAQATSAKKNDDFRSYDRQDIHSNHPQILQALTDKAEEPEFVPDIWEERLPKKVVNKVRKPLKIEKWFGFDTDSDNTDDSDETEWKEIDRKKFSEEKKKIQKKKKKEREEVTAQKASCMVGIGPIDTEMIEKNRNDRIPYDESKVMIVKQILTEELKYDELDIEELDIQETRFIPKGDGIMYIAFGDIEQVREIHKRKAELQNDYITVRNYIPPNYYDRYTHLSKVCKEKRDQDNSLKTQMRFGRKDVEIFVKPKGEGARFKQVAIEDFTDIKEVPKYDHSIKWRRYNDKPPRRVVSPQTTRKDKSPEPTTQMKTKPLVRQHSTGKDEHSKKTKLNSLSSDDEMDL